MTVAKDGGALPDGDDGATAAVVKEYQKFFDPADDDALEERRRQYMTMVNNFYDLVTDFYEFGWGPSFHFAPRRTGESFRDSITRCERELGNRLGLKPGMVAVDIGCGVGGPMREIAKHSGAKVVGVNNNVYQIRKAERYSREQGLDGLCSVLQADFMRLPVPDGSFDRVFCIEALPHAPDLLGALREIYRVLKPGGLFAVNHWCLTDGYDHGNADHRRLKAGIEIGNGIPELPTTAKVVEQTRNAGFEILEMRDTAFDSDPGMPWYRALQGDYRSLSHLGRTPLGRAITNRVVHALESVHLVPKGTTAVSSFLNNAADDLVHAGTAGIFTPIYFCLARKPE